MPDQKISLTGLTFLGFQLNAAIERGEGNCLSFDDIHRGLDDGDLFERIEATECKMDTSRFPDSGAVEPTDSLAGDRKAVLVALSDAAQGMEGREERKYGIKESGLSLLMAYTIEAIQQKSHWE